MGLSNPSQYDWIEIADLLPGWAHTTGSVYYQGYAHQVCAHRVFAPTGLCTQGVCTTGSVHHHVCAPQGLWTLGPCTQGLCTTGSVYTEFVHHLVCAHWISAPPWLCTQGLCIPGPCTQGLCTTACVHTGPVHTEFVHMELRGSLSMMTTSRRHWRNCCSHRSSYRQWKHIHHITTNW